MYSDEVALKTRGKPLIIGTWNVSTLYKAGNFDNGIQEMKNMKLDIMGISETRWTESGKITTGNHTMIYSRGIEHTHRLGFILNNKVANTVMGYWPISERVLMVKLYGRPFNINIIQVYAPTQDHSDAKIEALYEEIKKALKYAKSGVVLCAMGDLTPKVGREAFKSIVEKYRLGQKNHIELCQQNNLTITNTLLQHRNCRLHTWKSPGDGVRNQIDYISVNQRFTNIIKMLKHFLEQTLTQITIQFSSKC